MKRDTEEEEEEVEGYNEKGQPWASPSLTSSTPQGPFHLTNPDGLINDYTPPHVPAGSWTPPWSNLNAPPASGPGTQPYPARYDLERKLRERISDLKGKLKARKQLEERQRQLLRQGQQQPTPENLTQLLESLQTLSQGRTILALEQEQQTLEQQLAALRRN